VSVVAAFFVLGVVARLLRTDVQFPASLHQSLTLFLLIAIGLKGGVALGDHAAAELVPQALAVVMLGYISIRMTEFAIEMFSGF